MEAKNRKITDWLNDVRRGIILLPEFQRYEVWDRARVADFLSAIIHNRPLGVFLELEVDPDNPPFLTRKLPGTPKPSEPEPCSRNLLDGQQRLIALWKSLHGQYEHYAFYVRFDANGKLYQPNEVIPVSRTGRRGKVIGNPRSEFENNYVPMEILNPLSDSTDAIKWRKNVDEDDEKLEAMIGDLRSTLSGTSIPALTLSKSTTPEEAVDIFIQTNRSAYILSHFDLAVAQMQKDEKESLHGFVDYVRTNVPELEKIEGSSDKVGDLILKVTCLLQEKKPTFGNYRKLNFGKLNQSRDAMIKGFQWSVAKFEEVGVTTSVRLPTAVPMRVLPALHHNLPERGVADQAAANRVAIRYLWCAFLSDRYDRQANDRLKDDYDALLERIADRNAMNRVPAFDADLPTVEDLNNAGWPKRNRLGSAILLAFSQDGAFDLSDQKKRLLLDPDAEYHHIFPRKILTAKNLPYDLALNAMLLAAPANKEWLTQFPGDYLASLVKEIGRKGIEGALASHTLSLNDLLAMTEKSKKPLTSQYGNFLTNRARSVKEKISELTG